ncbi:UNVERIFIED_CONTAM: hypothetical protein FKN15_053351 [Acipenser sinensis]
MDVRISVSFFQNELASIIEDTLKAAADTVLWEITKVVGSKFTEFQMEMAGKEKENESLKLRLEISESELKAVRECMNAADADIKQPLRNMNPDCNEQDFQRNENQGLFIRVQASKADEGEHDSTPSPRCTNSSSGKPQCKKHRETTPQEENVNRLRVQIPSVQDRQYKLII